jgi:hypothetical protein
MLACGRLGIMRDRLLHVPCGLHCATDDWVTSVYAKVSYIDW